MANQIMLNAKGIHEEAPAAEALLPGSLLELTAAGKVQKHSTAGAKLEVLVAKEDALQGRSVADTYNVDDIVFHLLPFVGSKVQLILLVGEVATVGAPLYADAAGRVTVTDPGAGVPVAVAQEDLDLSVGGSVDTLIAARIVA